MAGFLISGFCFRFLVSGLLRVSGAGFFWIRVLGAAFLGAGLGGFWQPVLGLHGFFQQAFGKPFLGAVFVMVFFAAFCEFLAVGLSLFSLLPLYFFKYVHF